jgi:hypothetical protein
VLDRTKDPGSIVEPLFLDVVMACATANSTSCRFNPALRPARRHHPAQIIAVYKNRECPLPIIASQSGMSDDETNLVAG